MKRLSYTEVIEYKYDSEQEREEHVIFMEKAGYTTSIKRTNRDNYYNPKSKEYWYAEFYKH